MAFNINHYEVFAAISIIIRIIGYTPYFYEIFKKKCHPHAFSWFTYFLIDFTAFCIQFHEGAGAGAYVTLSGALISLSIAIMGWFIGKRDIKPLDCISFVSALMMLPLWYFIQSSLAVLVVIMTIEALGTIPTLRKATYKPYEERAYVFFFLGVACAFSLLAVEKVSLENMLYPSYLLLTGIGVGSYVVWRNSVMRKVSPQFY